MKQNKRWIAVGIWSVMIGLFIWWQWFHNPLPSDKKMINHFNAHKVEFEELVQGFRNHRQKDIFYERTSENVRALMKKLGVASLGEATGAAGSWYPEPYSDHTIQVRKSLEIRSVNNLATIKEELETLKRELPNMFEGMAPIQSGMDILRVSQVVHVEIGDEPMKVSFGKKRLRYFNSFINKAYYYFPQPPRVENGHIIQVRYSLVDNSNFRPSQRVFDSLDSYPPDWKRGEYVLKRIDDHWFICMWRTTN